MSDTLCFLGAFPNCLDAKQIFWIDETEHLDRDPSIQFFHLQTALQMPILAKQIAWKAVMQELKIVAAPGWEAMALAIEECHLAAHLLLSETADFGVKAFANARANWAQGPFYPLDAFKGLFSGCPAIICGAGPSLEEAAPFLKQFENRALIIAAGSGITALADRSIPFHLACALDKEAPLYRVPNTPCCIQSRLRREWVELLKGEKILAAESGPIPWEKWWLGEQEERPFGWIVGNFATQIALALGCSKIIWVGMDLCYQDGQKYAGGEVSDTPLVEARGCKTQRDWIMAARFFEDLAKSRQDVQFIQTASRGLPLAAPIALKPLSSIDLREERVFALQLKEAFLKAPTIDLDLLQKEKEWDQSLKRCFANAFQDLSGEIVYDFFLGPLWQIWRPLFEREMEAGQTIEIHRGLFFQQVLNAL